MVCHFPLLSLSPLSFLFPSSFYPPSFLHSLPSSSFPLLPSPSSPFPLPFLLPLPLLFPSSSFSSLPLSFPSSLLYWFLFPFLPCFTVRDVYTFLPSSFLLPFPYLLLHRCILPSLHPITLRFLVRSLFSFLSLAISPLRHGVCGREGQVYFSE